VEAAEFNELDFVALYIFADRHGVRNLQDDLITTIVYEHERSQRVSCAAAVAIAFHSLQDGDHLRQLMVHEYIHYCDTDGVVAGWTKLPSAFIAPVVIGWRD